ncbi:MAG: hypothetical protein ABWY25_09115 [Paenisporosarcina sp.]
MNQGVTEFIEHLSEQPWSNYTAADYSIEQWHNSCLIHQHEGPPTSKSQCKLPVKTPSGALNKNGVHAAAAALAGARGGVHASTEEKAKAARALRGYYGQMNEKPPPSLMNHSNVIDFIDHHGVKGMKWGVRNRRSGKRGTARTAYSKSPKNLTSAELERRIKRMDTEKKYNDLNKRDISKGEQLAVEILTNSGRAIATTVITGGGLAAIRLLAKKKLGPEVASMLTKRK